MNKEDDKTKVIDNFSANKKVKRKRIKVKELVYSTLSSSNKKSNINQK